MNINHLLLWFVGLSCVSVLVQTVRSPTDRNQGWRLVASLILGVTAVAFYLIPQAAGMVGGVFWAVLLVIPTIGVRWVNALTYQERYRQASRLATVLGWLHPADGWREYPKILEAVALGQQGQIDRAIAILKHYQSPKTSIGRLATVFQYRLEARWEDLLIWIQQHQLTRLLSADPGLMLYYLRSLGETGDLNELIRGVELLGRLLERANGTKLLNLARLFALAFCGQPEQVQRLLKRSFREYPNHTRQFWLTTAEMAAGDQAAARQQFLELQKNSDPILANAIARRLSQPAINPAQVLTHSAQQSLARLELESQQEARYSRPFTFVSTTSYVTYGLIALNLLIFALEIVSGGSQNLDTLYKLGALVPVDVWRGEWWRLLAANFLHFGSLHLTMNMLGLYFLGGFIESTLKIRRYLMVYFVSGVGAMFLITWFAILLKSPTEILVGASAAIMGLVGATGAIMLYGWQQEKSRIAAKNFRVLLFVIGIQVVFDLTTPGVSFMGHTLGLILGFLTTNILLQRWRFRT